MLHVIIDTSIYRNDPKRGKGAFRALTRLCEGGKIVLYIPAFVKGEFASQQRIAVEDEIRHIITAAKSITRRSGNERLTKFSEEVTKAAEKLLSKAGALTTEEFTRWAKRCKALSSEIRPEHAVRVMNDYFTGKAPFSSVKHREDIPDSFTSTMITSNRPVDDWGKLLGDSAAVTAMLDRLLHHGHVMKCGPRSWRTKTGLPPQQAAG